MTYKEASLRAAHTHSSEHREEVLSSFDCGCFFCERIYKPHKIVEWIDADQTALCPYCGVDSVLGDKSGWPITEEFLKEMYAHWFSIVRKP